MNLADVRDWLKTLNLFENYYIGRLDKKKKNSLGVYSLKAPERREVIGNTKTYNTMGVSLLVHGNTNKKDTEELAWRLYNELENMKNEPFHIGESDIYFFELLWDAPIDVDQDSDAVYEYVIELNFYVKK